MPLNVFFCRCLYVVLAHLIEVLTEATIVIKQVGPYYQNQKNAISRSTFVLLLVLFDICYSIKVRLSCAQLLYNENDIVIFFFISIKKSKDPIHSLMYNERHI